MPHAMTVRMSEGEMQQLETLAQFDGVAVAQEIREAVRLLVAERRQDPAFRARVNDALRRTQELLAEQDALDLAQRLEP